MPGKEFDHSMCIPGMDCSVGWVVGLLWFIGWFGLVMLGSLVIGLLDWLV